MRKGRSAVVAKRSVRKAEQRSCRFCDGTERGWGSHTQQTQAVLYFLQFPAMYRVEEGFRNVSEAKQDSCM